ncbi:MAG: general secretion pathway protein GspK, partial [Steroidobacteraceae bacterium]
DANGHKNEPVVKQFERLLELLELEPKWANLTVDWLDTTTTAESPNGAEDSVYAGQSPAYLTANMAITRTSEMFSQVGMTLAIFRKLEPYVTALPNGTSLNVCTAPALVLDSLATTKRQYSTDLTTFAANRASGCYPKLQDINRDFKGDPDFDQRQLSNNAYLVESSSYFRANILVSIGTVELAMYSVLNRSGNPNNAKVRVIQRSFGTT